MLKERFIFFLQLIKSGRKNASITPSSRFLAKEMIKWIDWSKVHTIVELGSWTWVFTEYICKHAHPNTKIIAIEISDVYIKILQEKFKNIVIIEKDDVKNIRHIQKKHAIDKVDLIISWLPFVPAESIHQELKLYISQGTIFRGFTYLPSVFKKKYADFPIHKVGFALLNIPPARVYGIN